MNADMSFFKSKKSTNFWVDEHGRYDRNGGLSVFVQVVARAGTIR